MNARQIFLLAGQSNMQGCGNFGTHPRLHDERLFNFKDEAWQVAREPLHDYVCKVYPDGGAGLAMSFGLRLLKEFPEARFGFVPAAVSGSSLDRWQPGVELFEKAVRQVRLAMAGSDCELCGILWHQGEADAKSMETAISYTARFRKMVNGFRRAFQNEDLPIIAGELGRFVADNPKFTGYQAVNRALADMATAFVSSEGLTDNDRRDRTHFDTQSQREFGVRYADAYLKLRT